MGGPDSGLMPIGFLADNQTLLLHDYARDWVSLRDLRTGKEVRGFGTVPHKDFRASGLSPDGKALFIGTAGTAVRVWDVATGKELEGFGHAGPVRSVVFHPNNTTIVSGSADKTAVVNTLSVQRLIVASAAPVAVTPPHRPEVAAAPDEVARDPRVKAVYLGEALDA